MADINPIDSWAHDWSEDEPEIPIVQPEFSPPSERDCEAAAVRNELFPDDTPLSDPCSNCGAFRMTFGWWACYGYCDVCRTSAFAAARRNVMPKREGVYEIRRRPTESAQWGAWCVVTEDAARKALNEMTDTRLLLDECSLKPVHAIDVAPYLTEVRVTFLD